MSKYYKAEDIERVLKELANEPHYQHCDEDWSIGVAIAESRIEDLPTIEVSEDCISRAWVQNKLTEYVKDYELNELDSWQNTIVEWIATDIEDAPSVIPKPKEGEWIPCTKEGLALTELMRREGKKWYGYRCANCSFIYKGNALTESPFCQNCGAKMKGEE